MAIIKLEVVLRIGKNEVVREYTVSDHAIIHNDDDLVEALAISIGKGFSDKPDIIKGMLLSLIEKIKP